MRRKPWSLTKLSRENKSWSTEKETPRRRVIASDGLADAAAVAAAAVDDIERRRVRLAAPPERLPLPKRPAERRPKEP